MLTRRTLLKSAVVGAAGAALPLSLYRPASTPAAVQDFSIADAAAAQGAAGRLPTAT